MKFTYHIKICAALWAVVGAVCLAAAPPASAAEPSWWTEQKRTCGLPSNLAYNNWDGKCNSSGGSSSAPSYDYGAAQRAQSAAAAAAAAQRQAEADRIERLPEEKRQKDAEFIRNRDAAARTLKGSTGAAMNQLKGLSGTDSIGLKGSGFDTGTVLKGLRGSDPVAPETTAASLSGGISSEGRNAGSGSKETCIPSQDPSVVDLCFLGNRSAAIDPRILKGMNPVERAALKASAKNMTENLLPFDKEIYQAVADMAADPSKSGKQWPGPKNQGSRLLNPLSEPEKVKAYWDKFDAGLHAHAEAEAKIVTASRKGSDWRELRARQDADLKFNQAIDQISRNQEKAEGVAQYQSVKKMREFLEKEGGADWAERVKNDRLFAARVVMERDALLKKMDQEISGARATSLREMTNLVKGWK